MAANPYDQNEPNDPTRADASLSSVNGAHPSSNEIEQLCLKAARGAGMSWGMAEEAGFAARWLAERGLDGPGALLLQLVSANGRPWHEICPVVEPGIFRPIENETLCPVALGAALCDHAAVCLTEMDKSAIHIGPVNNPILLLPFLSDLARLMANSIQFKWDGGQVTVSQDGQVSQDLEKLVKPTTIEGVLSSEKNRDQVGQNPQQSIVVTKPLPTPLFVSAEILKGLNGFAMCTTVPTSEASRADAGAAASDND